jgi:DNA-binding response OmpR family regulator
VVARVRTALGARIPAVVITGSTSTEVATLLEAQGLPMLPKPVSPARLRATLVEVLRRSGAG